MDGERKRKRAESGGVGRSKAEEVKKAPPEEDEMEEFFAILRRIHVAVKYFQKDKNKGQHDGSKVNGVKVGDNGSNEKKNLVFDLNVVPQVEDDE